MSEMEMSGYIGSVRRMSLIELYMDDMSDAGDDDGNVGEAFPSEVIGAGEVPEPSATSTAMSTPYDEVPATSYTKLEAV